MFFPRRLHFKFRWRKQYYSSSTCLRFVPLIAEHKNPNSRFTLLESVVKTVARLVFTSKEGAGVAAAIIDMGNRFPSYNSK